MAYEEFTAYFAAVPAAKPTCKRMTWWRENSSRFNSNISVHMFLKGLAIFSSSKQEYLYLAGLFFICPAANFSNWHRYKISSILCSLKKASSLWSLVLFNIHLCPYYFAI